MLEVQHTHEHLPLLCLNRTLKVAKFQTIKNKTLSKRFFIKYTLRILFIKNRTTRILQKYNKILNYK